jgi:iron complex transport system ATP-binding protein
MSERPQPSELAETGLQIAGLHVRLGHRTVVTDVSFTARAAAITVLLGPNGAGKSTILKAAAGILPYQGQIRVGGQDASTLERRARARAVAYVPQASALEAPVPVRDVVAQGRFAHGSTGWLTWLARPSAAETAIVASAMERTDVVTLRDRPFNQLSEGERRRVLVARALASGAPVLLLDEPTAALDVGHALALLQVLREAARAGTAVIIVLHQLQEAAAIADHAVLLADGRISVAGPVAEVLAPGPVRRVYGVELVPDAQFACRLPRGPA